MKKTAACVLLITMLVFCGAAEALAEGIKYAAVESTTRTVTTGFYNCAAIKNDGTLWVWGFNGKGALGDGTYINSLSPKKAEGAENVKNADIDLFNTVAVTEDGALYIMGDKSFGQLGNGVSESGVTTPVRVSGIGFVNSARVSHYALEKNGATDVRPYVMAVDMSGGVYAWGSLEMKLSGDFTAFSYTPRRVQGLPETADISVSGGRAMALTRGAEVYVWGYTGTDFYYADKAESEFSAPKKVEIPSGAKKISAGGHFLALARDGKVYGWGSNEYGEIKNKVYSEDGTAVEEPITSPAEIKELSSYDIEDIYAGNGYSLFKTTDGRLLGMGAYCSLFSEVAINHNRYPVEISVPDGFKDISAGNSFIAVHTDGAVASKGDAGGFGTFGDGSSGKTSKTEKYADIADVGENELFAVSSDNGSFLKTENPRLEPSEQGFKLTFSLRTSGKSGIKLAASLAVYDSNGVLCATGFASPSLGASDKGEYSLFANFSPEADAEYKVKLFIWDLSGLAPCYCYTNYFTYRR